MKNPKDNVTEMQSNLMVTDALYDDETNMIDTLSNPLTKDKDMLNDAVDDPFSL